MTKTYYLYLDESGDFDADLRITDRNECLVGGILYEAGGSMSEEKAQSIIMQAWYKENPGDRRRAPKDAIVNKIRHATELPAETKASLTAHIISETSKNAQIVIFENYGKTKIGDSVKTYINIMVDGVVQLLKRLSLEEERITLNIIAGFKKDSRQKITNNMFEGYINKQECLDMFNERFALMRAKYSDKLGRLKISFDYADDKRTYQLILCDYICNYRFTRSKPIYSKLFNKNKTYGDFISAFYDEDNIFSIKGGSDNEKLEYYLIDGGYALVLFDICAGVISGKKRCERVFRIIAKLPEHERDVVFNSLKNYIHNIVSNPYKLSQAEKVVMGGEKLIHWFESNNIPVSKFKLEILLYKLTILGHSGKLDKMETIFKESEKALREEIIRSENLKYYFIFYNRYAVYCIDAFDFEKAGEILDKVTSVFVDYKVVLSSLPYMEMDDESIISDQYARLMGTKAQYQLRMLQQRRNGITYEDVIRTLDESTRNFKWNWDKERQWQVRSDLEALCGNYDIAMKYLCKGCNVKHWKELFQPGNIKKSFSLLHLSIFVRFLSRYNYEHNELREIVKTFKSNRNRINKNGAYPEFIIAANIAEAMENLGFTYEEIKGMYSLALTAENNQPAFNLLRLVIEGGAGVDLYDDTEMKERTMEKWKRRCEITMAGHLTKKTKLLLDRLDDCKNNNLTYMSIRDLR